MPAPASTLFPTVSELARLFGIREDEPDRYKFIKGDTRSFRELISTRTSFLLSSLPPPPSHELTARSSPDQNPRCRPQRPFHHCKSFPFETSSSVLAFPAKSRCEGQAEFVSIYLPSLLRILARVVAEPTSPLSLFDAIILLLKLATSSPQIVRGLHRYDEARHLPSILVKRFTSYPPSSYSQLVRHDDG